MNCLTTYNTINVVILILLIVAGFTKVLEVGKQTGTKTILYSFNGMFVEKSDNEAAELKNKVGISKRTDRKAKIAQVLHSVAVVNTLILFYISNQANLGPKLAFSTALSFALIASALFMWMSYRHEFKQKSDDVISKTDTHGTKNETVASYKVAYWLMLISLVALLLTISVAFSNKCPI